MARSPGRKLRGMVRCTPWLGATIVRAWTSSICRTASTHTPVALITQSAHRWKVPEPSASSAVTPVITPLRWVRPETRM